MNEPTNVDSSKKNIMNVVGGQSVPLENGEFVMPPENAKDMKELCNQLWNEYILEISVENGMDMGKCSNKEINRLEQARKARMTANAIARKQKEKENGKSR
ncbi:MAG: hypothetical protein ACLTEH_01920 [Clostridia bacterium]